MMATGILRIAYSNTDTTHCGNCSKGIDDENPFNILQFIHLPNKMFFNTVPMCYNSTVNHLIKDNGVKT